MLPFTITQLYSNNFTNNLDLTEEKLMKEYYIVYEKKNKRL